MRLVERGEEEMKKRRRGGGRGEERSFPEVYFVDINPSPFVTLHRWRFLH